MGHLFEIIFDIISLILPGKGRDKRSSVGESQMDKSARVASYAVYALILLAIVGGIAWYSLRHALR